LETEIKKMAGLIQLALKDDVLYRVSAEEIINALDMLERSLYRELNSSLYPELVKKYLDELSLTLSNVIFNIGNGLPGISTAGCRMVVNRVNTLYKKVNTYLECYRPPVAGNAVRYDLLPLNSFFKTAAKVSRVLEERFIADELFLLLQPYINALRHKNNLPYHRWLWWMQFFSVILNTGSNENLCLEELLTILNFNTPEYVNWLLASLEKETAAKATCTEKLAYLSGLLIQYKLKDAWNEGAFNPAAPSVMKSLMIMIKTAIKKITLEHEPVQSAPQMNFPGKLGTALSVPQLALFIRLLVDTKVIDQHSQSLLLKNIASVIHTARVSDISPESLRINYYTPNTAAKNIVKEYLINMVNRLKNY
jgi:hypothetical protein